MPNDSRRNELLRRLARSWAGTADGPQPWSREEVDLVWPALAAHRVEVQLGGLIPPSLRTEAQERAMAEARERSRCQLMELERILPALAAAGCAPLLLKGAGLALAVYPDPTQRWFVDLDLLVPRAKIAAACAELERCGYRPFPSRQGWEHYDRHHLHRILVAPSGSVVELHWDLTIPGSPYRFDLDGVVARAVPLTVGRQTCLGTSPADALVHGVYQDLVDGFVDLRRLLDLALLLPRLDRADWRLIAALAAEGRMEHGLELSLHIVKSIFAVPVPAWRPRRPLGALSWRMLDGLDVANGCLARRATTEAGYHQLLLLLLIPGHLRRLAQVRRVLWLPPSPQPGQSTLRRAAGGAVASVRSLGRLLRCAVRALNASCR